MASSYWAAGKADDVGREFVQRVEKQRVARLSNGVSIRVRRNWRTYYAFQDGKAGIQDNTFRDGEEGELLNVRVNHARNIIQHLVAMITNQRPKIDCMVANPDVQSIQQTEIGNALMDYYFFQHPTMKLSTVIYDAVEMACALFGGGFIHGQWDEQLGGEHDVDDLDPTKAPRLIYEGDFRFDPKSMLDLSFDDTKNAWRQQTDVGVRDWVNKYDLMASHPGLEDKIDKQPSRKTDIVNDQTRLPIVLFTPVDSDDVEVWTWYHKKTPSMPQGRRVICLMDGTVLDDRPLPYKRIPIFRIVAAEMIDSSYGWSPMTDIAGMQEVIDKLCSAVATNQATFGVQNILTERGANVNVDALMSGLNMVEFSPTAGPSGGEPKALNLTQTPKEIFDYIRMMVSFQETISGVNAVVRGSPPPGLDANVALEMVANQAVSYMNKLEGSYSECVQDVAQFIIDEGKRLFQTERVLSIAGRGKIDAAQTYTGKSIESISRVTVDMGAAVSRTLAGRLTLAKGMADAKVIDSPEMYIQVVNSGDIDAETTTAVTQTMLMLQENEILSQMARAATKIGQPPDPSLHVEALPGDNHAMHIKKHQELLNTPQARSTPGYSAPVILHIQEHERFYMAGDVTEGIISGRIPPGAAAMMAQAQAAPPPGAPPGQPPHPAGPPGPSPSQRASRPAAPGGPALHHPRMEPPPGVVAPPSSAPESAHAIQANGVVPNA